MSDRYAKYIFSDNAYKEHCSLYKAISLSMVLGAEHEDNAYVILSHDAFLIADDVSGVGQLRISDPKEPTKLHHCAFYVFMKGGQQIELQYMCKSEDVARKIFFKYAKECISTRATGWEKGDSHYGGEDYAKEIADSLDDTREILSSIGSSLVRISELMER